MQVAVIWMPFKFCQTVGSVYVYRLSLHIPCKLKIQQKFSIQNVVCPKIVSDVLR